jgi:hypothetical protein
VVAPFKHFEACRATAVEKRILQHWADLVTGKAAATNVVALRRRGGDQGSS